MKKIISLIVVSLLSVTFLFSDELNKNNIQFQEICEKLSKNELFRGDFELKQKSAKSNRELISSGVFTLSAKDGIIWFTNKPIQSVMAVTDSYIIQEMKGKQKKIDGTKNRTFSEIAKIISSLFTGNYEIIDRDFIVECQFENSTDSQQNDIKWKAKLTPKDATISTFIQQVEISGLFSKNQTFIEQISLLQFNGDMSEYWLKNQKLIDNLTDNEKAYFKK